MDLHNSISCDENKVTKNNVGIVEIILWFALPMDENLFKNKNKIKKRFAI